MRILTQEEAQHINAIEDEEERLEAAGFPEVTVEEFLGLTPEESALIEMRLALSKALRQRRESQQWTQVTLAEKLGSSQSRVAKAEAGDPRVSLDLVIRALLMTGATQQDIGMVLARVG